MLWSNTEVIFDMLLQKSDHIEQFLDFAKDSAAPERVLMDRFEVRLAEYRAFWLKVRELTHATLHN